MGCNKNDDKPPYGEVFTENVSEISFDMVYVKGGDFQMGGTEAQWEYAARGGVKSEGYKYSGSDWIDGVAWYDDNAKSSTHPVGTKSPNELGIYDMSGNVWEWCSDCFGEYAYAVQTDPVGPENGSGRVGRGGSWGGSAGGYRVSYRTFGYPSDRSSFLGFRVALLP